MRTELPRRVAVAATMLKPFASASCISDDPNKLFDEHADQEYDANVRDHATRDEGRSTCQEPPAGTRRRPGHDNLKAGVAVAHAPSMLEEQPRCVPEK